MEYISHATLIVSEDREINNKRARCFANKLLGLEENDKDTHSDLVITGDEKTDYSIANIREIRKTAFYSPVVSNCKVYILRNIEEMPVPSQNALLKVIEEPPDNVYFIFTAQSIGSILPTVLSRVTTVKQNVESVVSISEEAEKLINLINEKREFDINCKLSECKTRDELISFLQEARYEFLKKKDLNTVNNIDYGIDALKKNANQMILIDVLSHKLVKDKI